MKAISRIMAVLTALTIVAAVIMKKYAISGANVMMLTGVFIFLFIFLVMLLLQQLKGAQGKLERIMHILRFVSLFSVAAAFVFILHGYPGARILLYSGIFILVVGFGSSYYLWMKKTGKSWPLEKTMLVVVAGVLIFTLASRNVNKNVMGAIDYNNRQCIMMTAQSDSLLAFDMDEFRKTSGQFPSIVSPYFARAEKIHKLTDKLLEFVDSTRLEVIAMTQGKEVSEISETELSAMEHASCYRVPSDYFTGKLPDNSDGMAYQIKEKVKEWLQATGKMLPIKEMPRAVISDLFEAQTNEKTGESVTWETGAFYNFMLISDVAYLNQLGLFIRQTEQQFISCLFGKARSEVMWYYWKKYQDTRPKGSTEDFTD